MRTTTVRGVRVWSAFCSADALNRAAGVPVLGQVSAAFSERDRLAFRQDMLRISIAAGCLVVASGLALVLSQALTA